MPYITIHSISYTDVWEGEIVDPDASHEDHELEVDKEEGETLVSLAVDFLRDKGLTEPSAVGMKDGKPWIPDNCSNIWYSSPDGSYVADYATGEMCQESAHLHEFDGEDMREIYKRMVTRNA